jgi:signal transduction histidine kinase
VAHASFSPVCRDREGRIWIATKLGAAVVRPEEWRRRREVERPPKVHLQEVEINDRPVARYVSGAPEGAGLRGIVVPPGPRRVEFRYIGIDLTAPEEVRYRYRLEGYEDGWTEAGDRAVAVYPDLPPGSYVFRVAAAGRYGLWNEEGAAATLTVRPLWWERTGTRVLAVLVVLALLTLGYVYRLSQIKAKTALQEEFSRALIWSQEAERKRLASELHDGLGHELLVLKGGIDRELKRAGAEDADRDSALSAKAREVIHRVREISHDLRPPELERYGIVPALESAALATAELTGIELAIELDAPERRLRPVVEISLFRIAQEALSNMARHSDASEGRVVLSHTEATMVLTIEDDGRGFDPAGVERTRRGPGLGLAGMEERAHLLGGTWECKSEPGNGTRITVTVPMLFREGEVAGFGGRAAS